MNKNINVKIFLRLITNKRYACEVVSYSRCPINLLNSGEGYDNLFFQKESQYTRFIRNLVLLLFFYIVQVSECYMKKS